MSNITAYNREICETVTRRIHITIDLNYFYRQLNLDDKSLEKCRTIEVKFLRKELEWLNSFELSSQTIKMN